MSKQNDNNTNDEFDSDIEISRLFHEASNEKMPSHLHDSIMASIERSLAEEKENKPNSDENKHPFPLSIFKPSFAGLVNQWSVPLSIAAGIVISVSLFLNNYDVHQNQDLNFLGADKKTEIEKSTLTNETPLEVMNYEVLKGDSGELQQYEIDSLRLIRIIEEENNIYGLIKTPDGAIYKVSVGNILGKNNERIIKIQKDKIEIKGSVKNRDDRWVEINAEILLSD